MVTKKGHAQYDNLVVLEQKSRTIKNKLPVTWIGKLKLAQDALVIFNCTASNVQVDRSSLATMTSITIDSEHSAYNAIPSMKIEDRHNPPRCSVNMTVFLKKGEHRFEMKGRTVGETREPSKGELYYDYSVIAVEDGASVNTTAVKKTARKVSKKATKKVVKKSAKKTGSKTGKKKAVKKKTTKKTGKKK